MAAADRAPSSGGVPRPTVTRLPLYRRALAWLTERGVDQVSSAELAGVVGVTPATLRRDLSRLGSYGTRGSGYDVATLLARVGRALALDREWPVVIVGVGNLGRALARSEGFGSGGHRVAALVDVDPAVVGSAVGGLKVDHLDDLEQACRREQIAIGVITTPAPFAQSVADRLVGAGVRSILNFAPVTLNLAGGVVVRQVDLAAELQVLTFYGARRQVPARPRRAAKGAIGRRS